MKRWIKKFAAAIAALCVLFCTMPLGGVTAYAASSYDGAAAAQYALANYTNSKWAGDKLCASFGSDCLVNGGKLTAIGSGSASTTTLRKLLLNTGLFTEYKVTTDGNYVYESDNSGHFAPGDIMVVQDAKNASNYVHTFVITSIRKGTYSKGRNVVWAVWASPRPTDKSGNFVEGEYLGSYAGQGQNIANGVGTLYVLHYNGGTIINPTPTPSVDAITFNDVYADSITETTAHVQADVTKNSALSQVGVKWGTTTAMTETPLTDSVANVLTKIYYDFGSNGYPSLQKGTTYYYQFFAVDTSGKYYYSDQKSFTTSGAETYTIKFKNPYSLEVVDTREYVLGKPYGSLPQMPEIKGKRFLGWYKPGNGEQEKVTEDSIVEKLQYDTLYYFYQDIDYCVTLDANGGTVSTDKVYVQYGSNYRSLPTPERKGYVFAGWRLKTADVDTIIADGDEVTVAEDHTLTAEWTAKQYGIKLNPWGGNVSTNYITATYGSSEYFDMAWDLPTQTGYTFNGWYTSANSVGIKVYDGDGYAVNDGTYWEDGIFVYDGEDVDNAVGNTLYLYAGWIPNKYDVTFDPVGGTVQVRKKTVSFGQLYGSLPTPIREGYKFESWYSRADYVSDSKCTNETRVGIDSNHTLYAKWTPLTVRVTFDVNGGHGYDGYETGRYVDYNTAYGVAGELPEPVYEGHAFEGWYTEPEGGTKVEGTTVVTATTDHTIYAHWFKARDDLPQIVASAPQTARIGGELVVTVNVKNNPGMSLMQIKPTFDEKVLQLTGVTNGDVFPEGTIYTPNLVSGGILDWEYNANVTGDGTLVTLTFKVLDDAAEGDTVIQVNAVPESSFSDEMEEVDWQSSAPVTVQVNNIIVGDVNNDGKVNGADRIALRKYLTSKDSIAISLAAADVNQDGKVNGADRIALRHMLTDIK